MVMTTVSTRWENHSPEEALIEKHELAIVVRGHVIIRHVPRVPLHAAALLDR